MKFRERKKITNRWQFNLRPENVLLLFFLKNVFIQLTRCFGLIGGTYDKQLVPPWNLSDHKFPSLFGMIHQAAKEKRSQLCRASLTRPNISSSSLTPGLRHSILEPTHELLPMREKIIITQYCNLKLRMSSRTTSLVWLIFLSLLSFSSLTL